MNSSVRARAHAKLNLFLHVGRLRHDGYHDLFSWFVFADIGDEITVTHANSLSLEIVGPYANALSDDSPEDNLVWRAAVALAQRMGRPELGAAIRLEKNLPVAAGVGGGSADAAAALRALSELWGAGLSRQELEALAFSLGADVPACLACAPVLVEGAGERLSPAPAPPELHAVIVNPNRPLSTGAVFKAFDAMDREVGPLKVEPPFSWRDCDDFAKLLDATRNDLQAPAVDLEPAVGAVLESFERLPKGCFGAYVG